MVLKQVPFALSVCLFLLLASCTSQPVAHRPVTAKPSKYQGDVAKISAKAFTCPAPPAPLQALNFNSIYSKASKNASVVDPQAFDEYKAATKELNFFESRVTAMANVYFTSDGEKPDQALCVQDWLYAWADNDALLGQTNREGELVRKWVLGSAATAWLQVKNETSLDREKTKTIRSWLRDVANKVRYDFPAHDERKSRRNNHLYWAAWSVMATGIALDQPDLYDWGLRRAEIGVNAITAEGTLPLEMDRGQKAINYHSYAAIPLFMMAEAASKRGTDLYALNNQGLYRLAERILSGINDTAYFEEKAGAKQDLSRVTTASNLVWLEVYHARTKNPKALELLTVLRPMMQSRIGGNLTLLYQHKGYLANSL